MKISIPKPLGILITLTLLGVLIFARVQISLGFDVPMSKLADELGDPVVRVGHVDVGPHDHAAPGGGGAGAAGNTALMAAPTQRVVYFDFDSFVIKDEFKGLLDAHAKVLVRDGSKRLVVEGHTDDRGGREYNLALGQKRAEAVAKSLALLGAGNSQMEAVSFGKERPAVQGSDEAAYAKNRRAELVYR